MMSGFLRQLRQLRQMLTDITPGNRVRHAARRSPRRGRTESLESRLMLAADFQLLKDTNTEPNLRGSSPVNLVTVGTTVYFIAGVRSVGEELYKSDGTEAGTVLVKDIRAGAKGANIKSMINVNGTLFFTADDGLHGQELWKTDGTTAGTVLVKDIRTGSGSLSSTFPLFLTNVNGTLFFIPRDNYFVDTATGNEYWASSELWKSDGTAEGTVVVKKNLWTGNHTPSPINLNGTLYLAAIGISNGTTQSTGTELWKSDGTEAGTVLVKDIHRWGDSSPERLTNVNGTLYFAANDGEHGKELWKSDGTETGTVLVKDIRTGSKGAYMRFQKQVNNTLYFTADAGVRGRGLWKSDGTTDGTVLVKDILFNSDEDQLSLTAVNGTVYFAVDDGEHGRELWKSDGTTAGGAVLVKDIRIGGGAANPKYLTNKSGTLYFTADDGRNGRELWKSDGTAAGTLLVKDIRAGSGSATPRYFKTVGGTLYFIANNGVNGEELWKSDGTAAGTVLVKDIREGSGSSGCWFLTNLKGTLYFRATDGAHGYELWKSDGTTAGTVLVRDSDSGTQSAYPESLTNVNGTLFFTSEIRPTRTGLWKSDGTADGTVLVKEIKFGRSRYDPASLTNVNGTLYFNANDGANGYELWKSDGTTVGTVLVKDIRAGVGSANLRQLINVNGILYFSADDGANGYELWKSDGTTAGTVLVKDIRSGISASSPRSLTNNNGILYFIADDGEHGLELWKSDGTTVGTVLVKDIRAGIGSAEPWYLTNVNGILYFSVDDGEHGRELWKSDGTTAGTILVKDIRSGIYSSFPRSLTNNNGILYFFAADGEHGLELWKSDGTSAGTVPVHSIASPGPGVLTVVNGTLYFTANDGVRGEELWKSDGTTTGTVLVREIPKGSGRTYLRYLTNVNGTLYFTADDGVHGNELWTSDGTTAGTVLVRDFTGDSGSSILFWDGFIFDNRPRRSIAFVGDHLFVSARSPDFGDELFVANLSDAPTHITLSGDTVAENVSVGTSVGTLTSTSPISGSTFTYSLVPGDGSTDNSSFEIVGTTLKTAANFDFETKNRYSIRLRTTDQDGLTFEKRFTITVLDVAVETVITKPAATTTAQRPEISWSPVPGATSYEVWVAKNSSSSPYLRTTVPGTSHVPPVDLGFGQFSAWVRPFTNAIPSQWSPGARFAINTATAMHSIAPAQRTLRPTISWDALSGAVTYDVWINDVTQGASQYIRNTNVNETSFTPSSDMPMGTYIAWVRGIDADGSPGRWSGGMKYQTLQAPTITAPLDSTLNQRPVFSWRPVPGATSYEIWVSKNLSSIPHVRTTVTGTSYIPPTDLPTGTYRWWVVANGPNSLRGHWSAPSTFSVGGQTSFLSPTAAIGNPRPTFTWKAVAGAVRYELWVQTAHLNIRIIHQTSLTANSYTPSIALATGTYRAWVRAVSSSGSTGLWSAGLDFAIVQIHSHQGALADPLFLPQLETQKELELKLWSVVKSVDADWKWLTLDAVASQSPEHHDRLKSAPTDFSFTHGFIPPVLTPVADEGDAGHFERRWPQNFSLPLEHHDAASHDSVMEEFVRFDFTR